MKRLRTLRRAKSRYRTARSAWRDIGKRQHIGVTRVLHTAHDRTHWVFKVR